MSLQAKVRIVLKSIASRVPAAVVTIKHNGESATGVRQTNQDASDFSEFGEAGTETSRVHVDASEITKPHIGATILIDDDEKTVTGVGEDPAGGLYTIDYQDVDPIEGV
jgi:hypothetical protein